MSFGRDSVGGAMYTMGTLQLTFSDFLPNDINHWHGSVI
jgi:hypothetical protein